jgi:hypothetical protein
VSATYDFVLEILRLAVEERVTILRLVATAVPASDSVTLRSRLAEPRQDEVIAERTEPAGEGGGGFARRRRTGTYRTIRMPVFDRFAPERKELIPAAYLLPPQHAFIVEGLRRHGIRVGRLSAAWQGEAEAFRVDSVIANTRVFEGHREVRVEGAWQTRPVEAGPGWFIVPTAQRLGILAAYLLEPASEDGFATWNLLDRDLQRGRDAPVIRIRTMPALPFTELP